MDQLFKPYGKHARTGKDKPGDDSSTEVIENAADTTMPDEAPTKKNAQAKPESDLNKPERMQEAQADADATSSHENKEEDALSNKESNPNGKEDGKEGGEGEFDDTITTVISDDLYDLSSENSISIGGDGLPDEAFEPREYKEEDFEDDFEEDSKRSLETKLKPNNSAVGASGSTTYANSYVSGGFGEIPSKKKRRGLKAFGITVGVLVIVVCAAYIIGAMVFMGRFLPNTTIGEYDVSMKSDEEVAKLLDSIAADYQIDIVGNGFSYRAKGADLGLTINSTEIIDAMHDDLNAWSWPLLILQQNHDESDQMIVTFKQASYQPDITSAVEKHNETATPPTNATITFDEKSSKYVVTPEKIGTQLNAESILVKFDEAISSLQPKLVLDENDLLQPTILSTDKKLIESAELATGMVSADLSLVMGGQTVGEVDSDTLSQFVTIDENLDVTFREDEMNTWIDDLAQDFNTVGTSRTYTRADGKVISVEGGVYGWEIDNEGLKNALIEGIKAGKASEIEVPCTETADVYSGFGERDWGNRYIDVDISEQHVRFYGEDGSIIWESDCISGSPDGSHNTWPGVWYVNAKESPSKLIGYENGKKIYETSVTFWMPFEGNGIGFHDATWQPGFGGTMYADGYGSHGCVNLSYSAAEELYGIIEGGDVVVVHS